MTGPRVVTILDSAPLGQARNVLAACRIDHLVVLSRDEVVGLLTRSDVLRCLADRGYEAAYEDSVASAMSRPPITIGPGDTVRHAAGLQGRSY